MDFPIKSMMLGLFTELVHFKLQLQWLITLGIVHTLKKYKVKFMKLSMTVVQAAIADPFGLISLEDSGKSHRSGLPPNV
jgi:hypothetical protein